MLFLFALYALQASVSAVVLVPFPAFHVFCPGLRPPQPLMRILK